MADLIVVVILAVLLGSAISYIVKAKKRGVKCIGCPAGGSCPSAAKPPKKKLDGPVIGKKTLSIEGNQIDGVSARVDLSKNQAVVSCDRIVSDEVLKEAVEKIGYHVTGIS